MYGVKVLDRCIAVINGRNKATLVHLRLRKTTCKRRENRDISSARARR